jgi:hypothetical protein
MGEIRNYFSAVRKNLFVFLLPVFFGVHCFSENVLVWPLKELVQFTATYLAVIIVIWLLLCFLYKDPQKAGIMAFCLIAFNLFFGSFHDFLQRYLPNSFITRYQFILPVTILFFSVFGLYLKKTRRSFVKLTRYLSLLMFVLAAIDVAIIISRLPEKKQHVPPGPPVANLCDTCLRPDIYLIVLDEYAGKQELADVFDFDNSRFESELKKRNFHFIDNPRSNYNFTAHSMASMFNMNYLVNIKDSLNLAELFVCRDLINNNFITRTLKDWGYQIYNYTFFGFANQPPAVSNPSFQSKKALFTFQTFIHRIIYDIGFHFVPKPLVEELHKKHLLNNREIEKLTKNIAMQKTGKAKFVYAHFAMPHPPYYLDSLGKETGLETSPASKTDRNAYIQYLVYTNKKVLELVDHIRNTSSTPPIVMVMSDHGFRQFDTDVEQRYHFMNLNAVYFPDGNYKGFYDGMSNVNQFRVIFNSQFHQKLPLLKDSSTFIRE